MEGRAVSQLHPCMPACMGHALRAHQERILPCLLLDSAHRHSTHSSSMERLCGAEGPARSKRCSGTRLSSSVSRSSSEVPPLIAMAALLAQQRGLRDHGQPPGGPRLTECVASQKAARLNGRVIGPLMDAYELLIGSDGALLGRAPAHRPKCGAMQRSTASSAPHGPRSRWSPQPSSSTCCAA
jgi:hypothetical protein